MWGMRRAWSWMRERLALDPSYTPLPAVWPDGEVGEMLVRGPSAAEGYWNQRAKSRTTFEGGWTRSGDKYTRDAEGYYTYQGRTAIQKWKEEASAKYEYTNQPLSCDQKDGKVVVTSRLTGNFPGSPVDLRFFFKLEGDRIDSLEIVP